MLKPEWQEMFWLSKNKIRVLRQDAAQRLPLFWKLFKLAEPGTWEKCLNGATPDHETLKNRVDRSIRDYSLSFDSMKLLGRVVIVPQEILAFLFEGGDWLPLAEKWLKRVPEKHHKKNWYYKIRLEVRLMQADRQERAHPALAPKPMPALPPPPPKKAAPEKPLNQWFDGHFHFFGELA